MKITIPGSTGFVGKVLVKKAVAAGYKVKTMARNIEKLEVIKGKIEATNPYLLRIELS